MTQAPNAKMKRLSQQCRRPFTFYALGGAELRWLGDDILRGNEMRAGKTAIVTGSTSGIGLGIATALAGQGANIVLNGFGPADEIEKIVSDLKRQPQFVDDLALAADIRLAVGRKLFQAERGRSVDDRSQKSSTSKRPLICLRDSKPADDQGREAAQPGSATTPVVRVGPETFSTLNFLMRIAQDVTASPAERCKAASEVARYLLPKKNAPRRPRHHKYPPDKFGFSVNPNWARELRDTKWKLDCLPRSRKLSPYAIAKKASKLQARITEIRELLQCPCPSKYRLKYYIGRTEVQAEIV